ncbi:hypothetical protein A9F13_01g08855 [Clavispora lusitaniae]|uniref:Uncharacterized protein n=1 Tax=Clavispora lusitaniae TaxID=36911 RepID=A0AA91Q527_CLALS|nr:hypothetical protein A9F13_01g08855 [Clavispora lusitaniae]
MPFADIAWRPCREDASLSQSHKQGPTLRRRCNLQNGVGAVFSVCLSVVLLQLPVAGAIFTCWGRSFVYWLRHSDACQDFLSGQSIGLGTRDTSVQRIK